MKRGDLVAPSGEFCYLTNESGWVIDSLNGEHNHIMLVLDEVERDFTIVGKKSLRNKRRYVQVLIQNGTTGYINTESLMVI